MASIELPQTNGSVPDLQLSIGAAWPSAISAARKLTPASIASCSEPLQASVDLHRFRLPSRESHELHHGDTEPANAPEQMDRMFLRDRIHRGAAERR